MIDTNCKTRAYKFDRLSKKAKANAIEEYRNNNHDYPDWEWWDCVYDEWTEKLLKIGFDVYGNKSVPVYKDGKKTDKTKSVRCITGIYFSGFYSQGDGACFDASCDAEDLAKHLGYYDTFIAWKCGDTLAGKDDPFEMGNINMHIYTCNHSYSHSNTRNLEITDWGNDVSDERRSILEDFEGECESLRKELCDELYTALEKEYDGMMSDETIAYEIAENHPEYRFDREGERID